MRDGGLTDSNTRTFLTDDIKKRARLGLAPDGSSFLSPRWRPFVSASPLRLVESPRNGLFFSRTDFLCLCVLLFYCTRHTLLFVLFTISQHSSPFCWTASMEDWEEGMLLNTNLARCDSFSLCVYFSSHIPVFQGVEHIFFSYPHFLDVFLMTETTARLLQSFQSLRLFLGINLTDPESSLRRAWERYLQWRKLGSSWESGTPTATHLLAGATAEHVQIRLACRISQR